MKRSILRIAILLCVLVLMLSGCIRREKAMQQQAMLDEYTTITYFQGGQLIGWEMRVPGKSLERVPQGEFVWVDEAGEPVDLTAVEVGEEDVSFYVYSWPTPELRTDHVRFLSVEGNHFYPEQTVTRGEAVSMLVALLELSESYDPPSVPSFTDVADSPHAEAIQTAAELGLLSGYADDAFRPDEPITRAEFAHILYRLNGEAIPGTRTFSDIDDTFWAYDALCWAWDMGYLSGYGDEAAYPQQPVNRAEAVTILNRLRGREPNRAAIDMACETLPYVDVLPSYWAFYDIIDASYSNELMAYIIGEVPDAQPGMILIDDRLCHVNADTLRLDYYTQGFHTIDGALYYVPQNGYFIQRNEAGLMEFDGSMFYVPETDGPFLTEGDYGYLHFGADGRYTSGSDVVDGYVDDILADILLDDSMSQEDKLYEAYCAIRDGGYFYITRPTGWQRGTTSWSLGCAEVMYQTKGGVCYYWASAFLYLARRLGYQAYPVCGGVGTQNQLHAWVVIEWDDGNEYVFDVELEWAYRNDFYQQGYAPTNMFKQPRNATNVIYVFPGESPKYYGAAEEESDEDLFDIPEEMIPPLEEEPEASEPPVDPEDPESTQQPEASEPPVDPEDPESTQQPEASEPPVDPENPESTQQPETPPTQPETPVEPETPPTQTETPQEPEPEPVPDPAPETGGETAA